MTPTHLAIAAVAALLLVLWIRPDLVGRLFSAPTKPTPPPYPGPARSSAEVMAELQARLDSEARAVALTREAQRIVEAAASQVRFHHQAPPPPPPAALSGPTVPNP